MDSFNIILDKTILLTKMMNNEIELDYAMNSKG